MRTIATIGLPVADSRQIMVGGGWIVVMLIGMAICFVAMFAFISLIGDGHGSPLCGFRWPQDTTRTDALSGTLVPRSDTAPGSLESEARR